VSAGYAPNRLASVQLATSGTLARRLDDAPRAGLVFIDECHHGGGELERIIAHYAAQGAWIIGLSATPLKMSGKGMGEWYQALECGPSIAQLMEDGRLSKYRLFAPHRPNLDGIKTVMGDYAKAEVSSRMEEDMVLTGNAVRHYATHAPGRLNVAFCTSVKHAELVAGEFRSQGGAPLRHPRAGAAQRGILHKRQTRGVGGGRVQKPRHPRSRHFRRYEGRRASPDHSGLCAAGIACAGKLQPAHIWVRSG